MVAEAPKRITLKLPSLYPKQRAAFFDPARTVVCEASTKAGKSVGALTWLVAEGITECRGTSMLWVSPVYQQAKVMYRRLRRWLARAGLPESEWSSNDTELFIVLPGGATLWFKGADRPDTIYGSDYTRAVIDEATRCKEEVYHAVWSTLTATEGKLRVIGNVKGRGNWAYRLARLAQSGEPDMHYCKITAMDAVEAGVLKAEIIEDARRKLPLPVFRQLYLAEPADDGGNPFGIDAIQACFRRTEPGQTIVYGVDLAKKQDWLVVIGLDALGNETFFARWQHKPWGESINRIAEIVGGTPALVDSTGIGDPVLDLLQQQIPQAEGYNFAGMGKQKLMEGLAATIQSASIAFHTQEIKNELDTFEYEFTRTNVRYSAPEGLHDDCVCALALAVQARSQFQPLSVSTAYPTTPTMQPSDIRDSTVSFDDLRKDPEWGWQESGARF